VCICQQLLETWIYFSKLLGNLDLLQYFSKQVLETWIYFGETRSLWVLCLEVLAHGSLKDKILWHLEQKYAKYVDENLELFKEKKHQITWSRPYLLSIYVRSKNLLPSMLYVIAPIVKPRVSFTVAWKNTAQEQTRLIQRGRAWSNQQLWKWPG